jgi:hypothetical protein
MWLFLFTKLLKRDIKILKKPTELVISLNSRVGPAVIQNISYVSC